MDLECWHWQGKTEEGRVGGLGEKGNLTFTTLGSCKLNLEQIA